MLIDFNVPMTNLADGTIKRTEDGAEVLTLGNVCCEALIAAKVDSQQKLYEHWQLATKLYTAAKEPKAGVDITAEDAIKIKDSVFSQFDGNPMRAMLYGRVRDLLGV